MDESLLLRFESVERPLNVTDFTSAEGITFDENPEASPLNIAIGLKPLLPSLLGPVQLRHNWSDGRFVLDAAVDSGGVRFYGAQGDRNGFPAGVYDLTVEVESYQFRDWAQRITIRESQQTVTTVHEKRDRRRVQLHSDIDSLTAEVLDHPRSLLDGMGARQWLDSPVPRPARKACLLNVLAKLRVPPDPTRGLPEPLTSLIEFVYFADVDRAYMAAKPDLSTRLDRMVETGLWVEEGVPKATIHARLKESLTRSGIDIPNQDKNRFSLMSYRQGGRNNLQIVVALPPEGFPIPTVYADVDIDLGNPL